MLTCRTTSGAPSSLIVVDLNGLDTSTTFFCLSVLQKRKVITMNYCILNEEASVPAGGSLESNFNADDESSQVTILSSQRGYLCWKVTNSLKFSLEIST